MNRGALISRVSQKLGIDLTAGTDELALMQGWANEAVVDVLVRTHIYIAIGDLALTSGTAEYRLDSTILAIDDGRGSTPAGIGHYEVIGLADMIDIQAASLQSASMRKYIAIEGDLLIVSPTPSTGESLRFFYVPRPTAMTSDSHDPSTSTYGGIPSECHRAIEYYMLWQGSEYDDKRTAMTPQDYFKLYLAECQEVVRMRNRKRGRGLLPARVGYPGSRRKAGLRNDAYPPR